MTHIGLLSDTHGYLDKRVFEHFRDVDEIWHAGDIGTMEVLQSLREFKPTRAVYGNMDGGDVRYSLNEFYRFRVEDVQVLLTHIGGYPGHYNPWLLPMFQKSLQCLQTTQPSPASSESSQTTGSQTSEFSQPTDSTDSTESSQTNGFSLSSHTQNSVPSRTTPEPTTPNPSKDRIDLFVCGHSHILKVQYDSHYRFLMMNPGAAGTQGWQTVQTLLRFVIDGSQIRDLEVIELERR